MNHHEEEIQHDLDNGKIPGGDALDIKAYQTVFKAIKNEPEFTLPSSFADKVVATAMQKQRSSSWLGDYFWFGVGIFLLLVAFALVIALTEFKFNLGFLNGLHSYKSLFAFALVFIGLLNWLDKRLIRPKEI